MEGIDEDDTFEGFVIAHAPTLLGVALVVTGEEPAARDAVDEAWPIVYRHWPRIAHSPHRLSFALAPLVAAAVRRAPRTPAEGSGVRGLQLREDGLVPAGTVPTTQTSEDLVGEALLDLGHADAQSLRCAGTPGCVASTSFGPCGSGRSLPSGPPGRRSTRSC